MSCTIFFFLKSCKVVYSTEGVYIADYKSSRAAHEATGVSIGSIARAAHGERRTGGGYVWRKVLADSPKDSIEIDLISKIGNHDKRPLIQKNLDGEIVGEFLSIAHASRSLKISRRSLSCALSGAQKTAGGTYGKRRWRMIFRFRNSRALDRGF